MLATITFAVVSIWIKKLVYRNIQQGDDLVKSIKARMLPSVFKIHN